MTPLQKIEQQRAALEKISEYMAMVSQIAEVGHNAARMINKSFRAYQNKEIQDLINLCEHLAKDYDLEYKVNIDSYDYDYNSFPNSNIVPMPHFILVLEHRYGEENIYYDYNTDNPLENEAMLKNELNNNYWESDSEAENPNAKNILNTYTNLKCPPYTRSDNLYNLSFNQKELEYYWQSSGGSLC